MRALHGRCVVTALPWWAVLIAVLGFIGWFAIFALFALQAVT